MGWNMDRLLNKAPKTGGRVRFLVSLLLSSPAVAFVHAPLLVAQTVAGIAIPFATGQFIDALVAGKKPCVLPEQAYCVTRILEGIYESAKTGNIVFLNK